MTALRKTAPNDTMIVDRIVAAIDSLTVDDFRQLGIWQDLDELSSRTEFEAIGADEASVVLAGERFEAVADLYVLLHYGTGDDEESLSDTYLATIRGKAIGNTVDIDEISVDTSSFYS